MPRRLMVREHEDAGHCLQKLRDLIDGYIPPPDSCNTYRALLDGLVQLETDMHQHVHKENNVLFPRAMRRRRRFSHRYFPDVPRVNSLATDTLLP